MDPSLIRTPIDGTLLRGHLDLEPTARGLLPHRLPAAARRRIPDARLASAQAQPSGVHLTFRTTATVI
ncbi:lipase, partial [Mycobacterium kansasii]